MILNKDHEILNYLYYFFCVLRKSLKQIVYKPDKYRCYTTHETYL